MCFYIKVSNGYFNIIYLLYENCFFISKEQTKVPKAIRIDEPIGDFKNPYNFAYEKYNYFIFCYYYFIHYISTL